MTKICFIDTETTSLRPDRRAWDIALISRQEDRDDVERQWFVDTEEMDLGNADLISLGIGRFHERHPQYNGMASSGTWPGVEAGVMAEVEMLTRGAHLVGAVPNFDAEVLAARMRAHGICPSWHYHLIDVEALAIGCLASMALGPEHVRPNGFDPLRLPWKSNDLAAALGIEVSDEDKHTALGDARWARAIYDTVTGRS